MKATVGITTPPPIRRKLQQGAVREVDERKVTKSVDVTRMREVIGIARKGLGEKSVAQWMEALRGPADLPRRRR